MKFKNVLLLQTVILLPIITCCQLRQLAEGDRLTKEEMDNILCKTEGSNYSINTKAKLFIIDFWDVTCRSCIAAFPKMDSLQKTFNEQIQIILVNRQTTDSTQRFFRKRNKINIPALPFISGDKIINHYFPHTGEPYHVWIDSSGVVRLTSYDHLTSFENVEIFLRTGNVPTNAVAASTYVRSLFGEKWEPALQYFSYLSNCIDNGFLHIMPENRKAMLTSGGCLSAVGLYQIAFNERNQFFYRFTRAGRTVLEAKKPYRYQEPENASSYYKWIAEYGYNYHLYLPLERDADKYKMMREDLGRYFNLDAKLVTRKVKGFVLKQNGSIKLLQSKGGQPKDNFVQADLYNTINDSLRNYINKPYEGFTRQLAYMIEQKFHRPFADSTTIQGNIDIVIKGVTLDELDISAINKELKQYGLVIIEKEILLEVLLIKERE